MMMMAFDALSASSNRGTSSRALIVRSVHVILELSSSRLLNTSCGGVFVLGQGTSASLPAGRRCDRAGGTHITYTTTDASKHATKFTLDAWLAGGSWLLWLGALHCLWERRYAPFSIHLLHT